MSKVTQKLELAANVLIIVVTIATAGVLARRFIFPPPAAPRAASPQIKTPTIGNKVTLGDFDWSKSNKTVLLVLQKGCRFCSESADFYRNLIKQTAGKNVTFVAVLPQSREDAEKYLRELNISGIDVRQSQLNSLSVGGTPTIIVADGQGKITDVWQGKLPAENENEVLAKLKG